MSSHPRSWRGPHFGYEIARTPAHPLDLALKNLDLAAERQHLSLELGLVAVAGGDHVQPEAHQRIQQRAHHPSAKSDTVLD